MSLAALLTAIFLVLTGLNLLSIVAVSVTVVGIVALVAGIAWLVEGYHPVTIWHRHTPNA